MRLVRLLPERWQKFIHEAAKFGIVGGVNTVLNYAVFNALALTVFVDGQLKATVIATIVATISSYLMNRHWTYRDRPKSAMQREYALFFLFNTTGLLIELGVLAAAKYGLGVNSLLALNVAKTGGVLLATLFRFWSYRTFVFQPAPPPSVAVSPTATAEPSSVTSKSPTPDGATTSVGGVEGDRLTELDPVATLAESMTELEEATPASRSKVTTSQAEPKSHAEVTTSQAEPATGVRTTAVTPRQAGFATPVETESTADLTAKLEHTTRRGTRR